MEDFPVFRKKCCCSGKNIPSKFAFAMIDIRKACADKKEKKK